MFSGMETTPLFIFERQPVKGKSMCPSVSLDTPQAISTFLFLQSLQAEGAHVILGTEYWTEKAEIKFLLF